MALSPDVEGLDLETWWLRAATGAARLADLLESFSEALNGIEGGLGSVDLRPRRIVRRAGQWRVLPSEPGPPELQHWNPEDPRAEAGFLAPELLFGCRREGHAAALAWSVGLSLLFLLRLSELARTGDLPPNPSEEARLRPQRSTFILDVHRKKPAIFEGRRLPAAEFLYPDQLPDVDRVELERALQALGNDGVRVDIGAVIALVESLVRVPPSSRPASLDELRRSLSELAARCLRTSSAVARQGPPMVPQVNGDLGVKEKLDRMDRELAAIQAGLAGSRAFEGAAANVERHLAHLEERFLVLQADIETLKRESGAAQNQLLRMEADLGVLSKRPPPTEQSASVKADWLARLVGAVALVVSLAYILVGAGFSSTPTSATSVSLAPAPIVSTPRPSLPAPASQAPTPQMPAPKEEAAPVPVETQKVRPEPARPAQPNARPEPTPENARPTESADLGVPGTLVVHGGDAWLEGPNGRFGPGRIPLGTYNLGARTGDSGPISLGSVQVVSGATVIVRCGFGSCRLER